MNELIVPILTSFNKKNKIDSTVMRNHADELLNRGADFLLVCGTTGLGPSLTYKEKSDLLDVFEDIPEKIIMQINSLNLEESKMLARKAKKLKVNAIASLPPYYYPRFPEEWYVRFYKEISSIYPTIVYNFPLTTNYDIQPSLIKKVNDSGGVLIGIKDTTLDLNHTMNFKWELGPDFKVYSGSDALILPAVKFELDGAVSGASNYAIDLARSIISNPDGRNAIAKQRQITSLAKISQKYGQWAANYSMVKLILKYDVGLPRPPVFPLNKSQEDLILTDINKIFHYSI